jgi:hypothetical protein
MECEIKLPIEYFHHLLNCLEEELHLCISLYNTGLDKEKRKDIGTKQQLIIDSLKKGKALIDPINTQNAMSISAMEKFNEKWNSDLPWILEQIKKGTKKDKDCAFKWSALVIQECQMFAILGKQVPKSEIDWLCERRGFDKTMRNYLFCMADYMGLGKKL